MHVLTQDETQEIQLTLLNKKLNLELPPIFYRIFQH